MSTDCVVKTHQLYDEVAGIWSDVYTAPGIEGEIITVEVPREDKHPNTLRRRLLSAGAKAAAVEDDNALRVAIANEAPVVRRAARTGWRDDNQVFVSYRFVSPAIAERTLVPPECQIVGAAGQLQVCGSLKGWRELVVVAKHSTAIVVGLCATFAAVLLSLLHRPSFALVFFGPSKIGKSFTQLVAASAIGFGREQDLPSLNATPAGLLAAALSFNDHMFPINEVATARGKKSDIYEVLRDSTYSLLGGQDTLRHPSWSGTGNSGGTFGVIALLSSEISPDAWAARNSESRDDGEMARLIGVPVLASGCGTIFDQPPSDLSGDALDEWERAQFKRLIEELPSQRGVAYREYLDEIVRDIARSQAKARLLAAHFEELVSKPSMSPVARDIVAKFGVLFAGGILAIDAEVLPLNKKMLGDAVRRACLAALAELPDATGELRADLASVKERLNGGAIVDLDSCTRKQLRSLRDADGFYKPRGEGKEFVIRSQVFCSWFSTPLRMRRILEWLADEGLLDHGRERTNKRSNEWAQKQVTWPDDTRVRSICIYLPNGISELDRDI